MINTDTYDEIIEQEIAMINQALEEIKPHDLQWLTSGARRESLLASLVTLKSLQQKLLKTKKKIEENSDE